MINEKSSTPPTEQQPKPNEFWLDRFIAKLRISSQTFILIVLALAFTFSLASGLYSVNTSYRAQNELLETKFLQRLKAVEENTQKISVIEPQVRQCKTDISDLRKGIDGINTGIDIRIKPIEAFIIQQGDRNAQVEERFFRIESKQYK